MTVNEAIAIAKCIDHFESTHDAWIPSILTWMLESSGNYIGRGLSDDGRSYIGWLDNDTPRFFNLDDGSEILDTDYDGEL